MENDHPNRLDALYRRAVDIGEQARNWFDGPGVAWRAALPADQQASVAIESLSTTARLMGVMSWLLDPAQMADAPTKPPCIPDEGEDLPPGSPLAGVQGGAIAVATRRLVGEVNALASGRTGSDARNEVAPREDAEGDGPANPEVGLADTAKMSMANYAGLWRR